MLLDSNIIIYSARADGQKLRDLIAANAPEVSAISVVEVLGFHRLDDTDRQYFEAFFASAKVTPVSDPVIAAAVQIRQSKNVKLGDALIAATAMTLGEDLLTNNPKDFAGIKGLVTLTPDDI